MRHERSRQELANAEKLFDLPITVYPELLQVQKEMSGLKMVYELYGGLKVRSPRCRLPEAGRDRSGPGDLGTWMPPWSSAGGRAQRHSQFGSWDQGVTASGDGVSVWDDEKVLELDSGNGCLTL